MRGFDPYIQGHIIDVANEYDLIDINSHFREIMCESSQMSHNVFNEHLAYIAYKTQNGFPIGIYRLRYRPKDRETGRGIVREQARMDYWKTLFNKLLALKGNMKSPTSNARISLNDLGLSDLDEPEMLMGKKREMDTISLSDIIGD